MNIDKTTNKKKYRLSRFCFNFKNGHTLCLYHAIGMSPIYIDGGPGMFAFVAWLERANFAQQEFIQKFPDDKETGQNLFKKLSAKKFIVQVQEDEQEELTAIQSMYLGRPQVSVMYLLLTDQCNLACKYCFVKNNFPAGYTSTAMNSETVEKAIEFFARQVAFAKATSASIIFYGGEPLLNTAALTTALEKIKTMRRSKRLPWVELTLVTNGIMLTPEIAKLLKQHQVTIVISIDGPGMLNKQRASHSKTIERIFTGLKILRETKTTFGISCTLNDESLNSFDEILSWIINNSGAKSVGFNIIRPIPPFKTKQDYSKRIATALIHGYEILTAEGIQEDRMSRKVNAFVNGDVYPFDCAGCGNQIVVSPKGEVGICAGYLGKGKYFVTNINDESFDHRQSSVFQGWSRRSPLSMRQCLNCPAIALCGGGCPYSADVNKGDIFELDDIFCEHAKQTLEYLIWKLYETMQ